MEFDLSQTWQNHSERSRSQHSNDDFLTFLKKSKTEDVSVDTLSTWMEGSTGSLTADSVYASIEEHDFLKEDNNDDDFFQRQTSTRSLECPLSEKEEIPLKRNRSLTDLMEGTITRVPSKARVELNSKPERTSSMAIKKQGLRGRRASQAARRSAMASEEVVETAVQRTKSMAARYCSSLEPAMKPVPSPPSSKPRRSNDKRSSSVIRSEVEAAIQETLAALEFNEDPISPSCTKTTESPRPSLVNLDYDNVKTPTRTKSSLKKTSSAPDVFKSPSPDKSENYQAPSRTNYSFKKMNSEPDIFKSPSPDRREDFKVVYSRTPSSTSSRRVSELAMKVKQSRESFQKLIDQSSQNLVEPAAQRRSQRAAATTTSRSTNEHETQMQQQLREKEEMIQRLSRELENAKALNQERTMEIRRSRQQSDDITPKRISSACLHDKPVRRKSRNSSLPIASPRSLTSPRRQNSKMQPIDRESISSKRKPERARRTKDPLTTSSHQHENSPENKKRMMPRRSRSSSRLTRKASPGPIKQSSLNAEKTEPQVHDRGHRI